VADLPHFATALRGYDRQQVDDYVATLLSYLEEAAARLERAEGPGRTTDAQVVGRTDPLRRALGEAQRSVADRLAAAERALGRARSELEALAAEQRTILDQVGSGPA